MAFDFAEDRVALELGRGVEIEDAAVRERGDASLAAVDVLERLIVDRAVAVDPKSRVLRALPRRFVLK